MRCKYGKTCAYIVEEALPPNPMFPLDAFRSSPLASNYYSLGERIVRRIFVAGLWLFALVVLFASSARAGDTVYYYHNDAQGTPVVVTDAHGNVVERTYYGPYGEVLNRPLRDGPGYTGHEEDAATGLLYMQQRYYDPVVGRFPSADPVDVDTNTGANFNRYWYANDNPYRYTDPDGRCADGLSCDTMVQNYGAWANANPAAADKLGSTVGVTGVTTMLGAPDAAGLAGAIRAVGALGRQTGEKIVAGLAKNAIKDDVKGAVRQIVKDGGEKQFNKDAATAMKGADNVKTVETSKGTVQVAEHGDGTTVSARSFSGKDGTGSPTIQVNDPSTKIVTKVRYPDDH